MPSLKNMTAFYQEVYISYNKVIICVIALYFSLDHVIWEHFSITFNNTSTNSITQLYTNHYIMVVIQSSYIECKYTGYMDTKNVNPPLEGYSIFTSDFIIPAVNF